jgi:hypothetical protein
MKRIFILIFIALSFVIFYQMVLSQNGIIEGYRVQEEKKVLLEYKSLLEKEKSELDDYIDYIKNNPEAKVYLANKLGYFFSKNLNLVKIKQGQYEKVDDTSKLSDIQKRNLQTNQLWEEIQARSVLDKTIKRIRSWTIVGFILVFGFFTVVTILGTNVTNYRSSGSARRGHSTGNVVNETDAGQEGDETDND